jgi:hypothetical protein
VPENRTCAQADVAQHWCACHEWHDILVNESIIQQYSRAVVDFLNNFMSDYKQDCATLTLLRVNKASQLNINNRPLKSGHSNNENSGVPQFQNSSLKLTNETRFYQIQLETTPGQGQFEVTAEYDPKTKTFDIQKRHLSRMNKYGEMSACIAQKRPDLREICYCSNLLVSTNVTSTVIVMNNQINAMITNTVANGSSVSP